MKVLQLMTAVSGIALAGLGGAMAITNPGQKAYEQYATEQLTGYLKEKCTQEVPQELGGVLQRHCKSLVDTGRPQLQRLISHKTERHNFVFFSIYRTKLSIAGLLPGYQFETIGVFQNFYLYDAEEL